MKILLVLTLVIFLQPGVAHKLAGQEDQTRAERRHEQYQKTEELVETGDFIFEALRAYPTSGRTVDLITNPGFIEISGKKAETFLPYFGRAYSIEYGGRGGIEFSGEIENREISKDPEKARIIYSFDVNDSGYHKVIMNIGYDGTASVSVLSSERSHINYHGNIVLSDSK